METFSSGLATDTAVDQNDYMEKYNYLILILFIDFEPEKAVGAACHELAGPAIVLQEGMAGTLPVLLGMHRAMRPGRTS